METYTITDWGSGSCLTYEVKTGELIEDDGGMALVNRLLKELGVKEEDMGYFDDNDMYVINEEKPKAKAKAKPRPQDKNDSGLVKWHDRKWPVGDNGLPLVDPGLYWVIDTAEVELEGTYRNQNVTATRLCLMNSNKKIRYGFLNLRQRDSREASIVLKEQKSGYGESENLVDRTPTNLLRFADKLLDNLEKLEAKRKAQAKKDELLGDYRFKALQIEGDR